MRFVALSVELSDSVAAPGPGSLFRSMPLVLLRFLDSAGVDTDKQQYANNDSEQHEDQRIIVHGSTDPTNQQPCSTRNQFIGNVAAGQRAALHGSMRAVFPSRAHPPTLD